MLPPKRPVKNSESLATSSEGCPTNLAWTVLRASGCNAVTVAIQALTTSFGSRRATLASNSCSSLWLDSPNQYMTRIADDLPSGRPDCPFADPNANREESARMFLATAGLGSSNRRDSKNDD